MSRHSVRLTVVVLTVLALLALAFAGAAIAAQGGGKPDNPGGGGGGNKPPSEATNSLSVPAIMVAGVFTGINAPIGVPSVLDTPEGTPSTDWPINPTAYYFVQRVNGPWQAQAYTHDGTAGTKTGTAEWGDNLAGDAKLKVGSPIRVELGLFDDTGIQLVGYLVDKLEPDKLDRESAYGTIATDGASGGTWVDTPVTFGTAPNLVRIYDSAVTLSILNLDSGVYTVPPGTQASAEINAKGAIVYGYNLRVGVAGQYRITYTIPNVDITDVDAGDFTSVTDGADTVWLDITVIAGGGGGGKPQ